MWSVNVGTIGVLVMLFVSVTSVTVEVQKGGHEEGGGHEDHGGHGGVHLASWRWDEFSSPVMFTSMIIVAVLLKIIFHHLTFLEKLLPESCVLIVVGIISGLFINFALTDNDHKSVIPHFTANLFFNILLPPIIFDSALSLYDKEFFNTFGSVTIFAVFGTLFNVFTIGYSLYGLSYSGILGPFTSTNSLTGMEEEHHLQPIQCLIFSSLISAVDPVAVLAIFEQIHVNMGLYFLVFGESLFNDGVTVVLYNTMIVLTDLPAVGALEVVMAVLSFFCVVFGGGLIGFILGIFASIVTRFTKHVRVVEPLLIFSSTYIAFLFAELFHWSGIISIIAFGITAKRFAFQNISQKSFTTVKYAVKTLASTCDCIIFIFLGLELTQENHHFHPGFIIATILLCLIVRFLSTFLFSFLVNTRRLDKITLKEQFIMAYGGLRGAVGFSLAVVLGPQFWYKDLFVTTALMMVFFTVFLQGGTIKFLVKGLEIELQDKKDPKICLDVQNKVMEDLVDGVTSILGKHAAKGLLEQWVGKVDRKLKKILIHEDSKHQLQRKFETIALDDHFTNLYAPRVVAEQTDEVLKGHPDESLKDTRKHFKKGIKSSNWEKFRRGISKEGDDPRHSGVLHLLEVREEDSRCLYEKVVHEERGESGERGAAKSWGPSKSWGPYTELSERTRMLKAQYDDVQAKKKHESDPSSIVQFLRKVSSPKQTEPGNFNVSC